MRFLAKASITSRKRSSFFRALSAWENCSATRSAAPEPPVAAAAALPAEDACCAGELKKPLLTPPAPFCTTEGPRWKRRCSRMIL
jgi:hypothetical protein